MPAISPSTIDVLQARAREAPDATALIYMSGQNGDARLTRADLLQQALDGGRRLAARGVRPGDVVLVAVDHGVPQVVLFLAALCAGAVPCLFPAFAPKIDPEGFAVRLAHAVERLRPRAIVSDRPGFTGGHGDGLAIDARTIWNGPLSGRPEGTRPPGGSSAAFLQLSSGSTGRQKVIPITHGVVIRFVAARNRAFAMTPADVVVNWVPLYHDLGLVTGVLAPLLTGIPTVLMSPLEWLARPAMLLQAVHRYGATICTMPNFAIGYCARRIRDEDLSGVRLDGWRLLVSGAEPVHLDTLDRFADRFARWGFDRRAFATAYGLAEHTLTVTLSPLGRPPVSDRVHRMTLQAERRAAPAPGDAGAVTFVSCGRPLDRVEIEIRSPSGAALDDREVGEVFLRSPYVFEGYWNDPDRTAEVLRDGWLATGDLGYQTDGELFICGRLNDLIIVGGMNVSAEDVEAVAAQVPGVKPGRVAAFGVPDARSGSEGVIVVAERTDAAGVTDDEIELDIRARVRRELDVPVGTVALVPAQWIVKTTSGKNARWATRNRWLAERTAETQGARA